MVFFVCLPVSETFFISSSSETMSKSTLRSKGRLKRPPSGNSTCWIFQDRHWDVQWNWQHYTLLGHATALDDKKRQYPWQLLTSLDTHGSKWKRSFWQPHDCTRWHRSNFILGLQLFHSSWSVPARQLATKGTLYSNPTATLATEDSSNKSHIFSPCKGNPVLSCPSYLCHSKQG